MILPGKHIRFSESLLGFGGKLLELLASPMTIDELWNKYSKVYDKGKFPAYHSFDNMVLALNFLFLIGAIEINNDGIIHIETN